MKVQIGQDGQEANYAKSLIAGSAKMGKTVGIMASVMGVLPWQKYGGVCKHPSEVHLLGFDQSTATGIGPFFKSLNAPADSMKWTYWNMQDDVLEASRSSQEWDYSFFDKVMKALRQIQDKMKPGGVLVISSLTTLALTLERQMAGPAGQKQGGGMDQSKWQDFARQLVDIRAEAQVDNWHCIWEAHIYKPPNTSQNKDAEKEESLQVSGKTGFNFPNNVSEVFRMNRQFGSKYPGSKIDRVEFDTRPVMSYTVGGRLSNEKLLPKMDDLTLMYYKLGLKVGYWGRKGKAEVSEE